MEMSEIITSANVTSFVRSLVGEPITKHWTDEEITLYIKFGMLAVQGKYWYMMTEGDKSVKATSLVVNQTYVSMPNASIGAAQATAVLDDATFSGTYNHLADLTYRVEIDLAAATDTFKWSKDGGTTWEATGTAVTGTAQELDNGVFVTIAATTGHTLADLWDSACVSTDCNKIVKIEVASDGSQLRYIDEGEIWKYDLYNDGAASSNYLNVWYLKNKSVIGDFPETLRPLIAIEAIVFAMTKDRRIDVDVLQLQKRFADIATIALAVAQVQEPTLLGDSELIDTYTSTNPVAWSFRDGRIYLYKYDDS